MQTRVKFLLSFRTVTAPAARSEPRLRRGRVAGRR